MRVTELQPGMLRMPLKTPFRTVLRTVGTAEDVVCLSTPAISRSMR